MFYHLKMGSQIRQIVSNLNLLKKKTHYSTPGEYKDIMDGLLYKKVLESDIGDSIKKREAFTFTINTDGISFSESSNLSLWPVYLVINEVDPAIRFCIENNIIAGILQKKLILFFKLI